MRPDPAFSAAVGRLAVFGDVHGNLAALDTVLGDIRGAGIDTGVCTGDLVLRGAQPEVCVSRVALLGWPCVQGNTDAKVAGRLPRSRSHPAAERVGSRSWTHHRLSDASLRFLDRLPMSLRVRVGRFDVLVMHGAPDDPAEVLVDLRSPEHRLAELAEVLRADCVITGHTHRPGVRRAGGCVFVNPGSVGEPLADDPRPSWAWIEAGPSGIVAHLERSEVRSARNASAA